MTDLIGPRLRAALQGIPSYVPGRAAPPIVGGHRVFKLSSNENPFPPLPSVLEVITAAAQHVNRYPNMFGTDLVSRLAARLDVPPEHLALGTGSVAVAQQVLQAVAGPGDEIVYAWRSFEAYPILVQISGATSVQVPLRPDETHDLPAMAEAITERTRCVFVCNPNNPTGTPVRRAELERFLDAVPDDVLVMIDEAYREFVRDDDVPDALDYYRSRPNVCVLRTFSKAYGLAGLRVGYGVASGPVADALRKTAVPFGVTGLAQDAAIASLAAEHELFKRVDFLVEERARVLAGLQVQGWPVPESQANFVWLRLGEQTLDFAEACERAGVIVRPFANDGVRVTIGEPSANDVFLQAAEQFSKQR